MVRAVLHAWMGVCLLGSFLEVGCNLPSRSSGPCQCCQCQCQCPYCQNAHLVQDGPTSSYRTVVVTNSPPQTSAPTGELKVIASSSGIVAEAVPVENPGRPTELPPPTSLPEKIEPVTFHSQPASATRPTPHDPVSASAPVKTVVVESVSPPAHDPVPGTSPSKTGVGEAGSSPKASLKAPTTRENASAPVLVPIIVPPAPPERPKELPPPAALAGKIEPVAFHPEPQTAGGPTLAHDPDYHWLAGELWYAPGQGAWRIHYANPKDGDHYNGVLTLTETGAMDQFRIGQLVYVEGKVTEINAASPEPVYRVRKIYELGKTPQ
ncbi:MAG: hypothetical protein JO112_21840 [Planctomycetes bacterium]|nr:hypothetical protein [Planctomycetota bacterium]